MSLTGNNSFTELFNRDYDTVQPNCVAILGDNCNVTDGESSVKIMQKPRGGQPLLVKETGEPENNLIPLNRNVLHSTRTYSRQNLKDRQKIKVLPKRSLESMVYEVLDIMHDDRGRRPQQIKEFIFMDYGMDFEEVEILRVLRNGIKNGKIMQTRLANHLVNRYRLSTLIDQPPLCVNEGSNKKKANITDVQNTHESTVDNGTTNTSEEFGLIRIRDLKFLKDQDTVEDKLNMSLNNECLEKDFALKSQEASKLIWKSEILPVEQGKSAADNNSPKESIDVANRSENYESSWSENMFLFSDIKLESIDIDDDNKDENIEMNINNNLSSKEEISTVPDNVLTFSSECNQRRSKRLMAKGNTSIVALCGLKPRTKVHSKTEKSHDTNIKRKPPNNDSALRRKIASLLKQLEEIESYGKVSKNSECEKSNGIDTEERLPQNNPTPKHGITTILNQTEGNGSSRNSKDEEMHVNQMDRRPHQTDSTPKHRISCIPNQSTGNEVSRGSKCEKIDNTQMERRLPENNSISEHKITSILNQSEEIECNECNYSEEVDFNVSFDVKYTLAEINEYMSAYPSIISSNLDMSMPNLSWERVALMKNVTCLKLTGVSIPSNENITCTSCGSELKFATSVCDVCSFDTESIIVKCNICHLICNREDVFNKHYLWEHRPSIQKINDDSVSIVEQNIGKLLSQSSDNSYKCTACPYVTSNFEDIDSHIIDDHTSKINIFPPLPEEEFLNELVIFQNEITNTCCTKCLKCGFITNRGDFMVYHILDAHELAECNDPLDNDKPRSRAIKHNNTDKLGKPKTYGLCYVCGHFFNHLSYHLKGRHKLKRNSTSLNANVKKSTQNQNKSLSKYKGSYSFVEDWMMQLPPPRKRTKNTAREFSLCHFCGKLVKGNPWRHLLMHNNEIFDCNVCGKQFNRLSNLATHKRVHTREKPFQCDICKMMFGYKCSVKGHIINVHSDTIT